MSLRLAIILHDSAGSIHHVVVGPYDTRCYAIEFRKVCAAEGREFKAKYEWNNAFVEWLVSHKGFEQTVFMKG